MNARIKAISYFLPEIIISNEFLQQEFPEWSVEKIERKTGIRERRIARKNQTSLDLGIESTKLLFKDHSISLKEIDYILLCTQSPDYFTG